MGKLTYLKLAEKILLELKQPLSAIEIWSIAEERGLTKELSTIGKTPWNTISAQLYISIRDDPKSIFYQHSSRPAKFYLNKFKFEEPINEEISEQIDEKATKFCERDLHPLLVKFANSNQNFKAHLKTIFHENSSKRRSGFNEWLHPDIVGVYFPFEKDLDRNALELQKTLSLSSTRLFSYELKKELNWANLRQCYFQAVSNSSWAHEGYLVTLYLNEDSEFIDELRRLNNAFGIGIIKLDPKNIYESEILFPAKRKDLLDWDTINRLISTNVDFKEFIQRVTKDTSIMEISKHNYDMVLSDKEFDKYIIDKSI
jgi:hypothetical protein